MQGAVFRLWLPDLGPLDAGPLDAGQMAAGPMAAGPDPAQGEERLAAPFTAPASRKAPDPDTADTAGTVLPDLSGRTVLVVDDIATNRLVACGYLASFGAATAEARDGAEALEVLAGQTFDLVLLDINMPGLDGFATFRRLRDVPGPNRTTPVVAMTADAMATQRAACLAAGMEGHLAKPFTAATLATELRPHLRPLSD